MRYARGKSTHQRVADDSTSWKELKSTPAKSKNSRNQRNEGERSFAKDRRRSFGDGKKRFNSRDEEMSSNFTPLGERPTKTEDGETVAVAPDKNSKGFGKSRLVKVFSQFWVPPEDAKSLQDLQKKLQVQGLSRKEISTALQNEIRRAEKAGKRRRDKICFSCRQFGHVLSDCPKKGDSQVGGNSDPADGGGEICFKCGSTEHTSRRCKRKGEKFSFANCFICSKSGHIARQCPDNDKGIYPSGGSCGDCGGVTHLRKDCPTKSENGGTPDLSAIATRINNPFVSTEYEPEDTIVEPLLVSKSLKRKSEIEKIEDGGVPPPPTVTPKIKNRKIKF